ncbi:MAG: hypothetical protein ACI8ZN_002063 [Bacteroidia bacterium]|jgi:hypothetical protein
MKNPIYLSVAYLLCLTFTLLPAQSMCQITISLGSGTTATTASTGAPTPYNTEYNGRIMQFVYTASEIKAAGGSEGTILSMAWKIKDTTLSNLSDYGIWMKHTSASNVASHDGSNLKQVVNRHTYPIGSQGWQTKTLDSAFYWNGSSNLLIHVCYGPVGASSASGTVYVYNTASNQRRGEYGKGSICGTSTSTAFSLKPFLQLVIDPVCIEPSKVKFTNVSSNSADVAWTEAASGAKGYEYSFATSPATPTTSGTYTTDTSLTLSGLCPSKLYYFYVRSVCGAGDTSDWSKTYALSTQAAGKISTNAPVCVGDSLFLSVEGARSYSWGGPSGFNSTNQNPFFSAAQKSNGGNYFVTITDSNYCTLTYSATVRIDSLPTVVITQNAPLCAGQDLELSTSGGESYSWSGPNGFTSDTNVVVIANTTTSNTGTYQVDVTNSFGCSSTNQASIAVHEVPSFTVASNTPICAGDTLRMTATGNYTYDWSGPNSYTSTEQNPTISAASAVYSGTYTIVATNDKNCSSTTTLNALVNPLPKINVAGNTKLCQLTTLSLEASGAKTYSWLKDGNSLTNGYKVLVNQLGTSDAGVYRVIGTDSNGCVNWTESIVEVLTIPSFTIVVPDSVCEGKDLTISATTDASLFGWTGPNGFTSTKLTETIKEISKSQQGTYKFKTTANNGCSLEINKNVSVLSKPIIVINAQGKNLLASAGYSKYTWYLGSEEVTGQSERLLIASSTGSYTVKVTGVNGCEGTSTPVVLSSLGLDNLALNDIVVYPNPANEWLNINTEKMIVNVMLINSIGVSVLDISQNEGFNRINIASLKPGVYNVLVLDLDGSIYRSMIIKEL